VPKMLKVEFKQGDVVVLLIEKNGRSRDVECFVAILSRTMSRINIGADPAAGRGV